MNSVQGVPVDRCHLSHILCMFLFGIEIEPPRVHVGNTAHSILAHSHPRVTRTGVLSTPLWRLPSGRASVNLSVW